ncbi:Uncharacterised protein [Streptococcus pneumoniae]|nr:Uncharacterised protein [Streptococcus pneumoniae]CJD44924.1 Uncharacterised protein [Streptococcus pneumoniae]CJH72260.1 Uncharacterised protein [Streptococcus pneumoniae]CJJ04008.1 Uncharacterised protein [Streptococcus pneumoniae]
MKLQKYLTTFLKMESMILKNIKMIYFLIMKGFWEGIYQHLMLRKKMTNSIKTLFFSYQSYSKNTVKMEKLFSRI